jgi:hypothetical protein
MAMGKLLTLVAVLAVALSLAGLMIYSTIEVRAAVRLNPELERLAVEYLRKEEQRREHGRKVDEANRKAERDVVIPMPTQPPLRLNLPPSK